MSKVIGADCKPSIPAVPQKNEYYKADDKAQRMEEARPVTRRPVWKGPGPDGLPMTGIIGKDRVKPVMPIPTNTNGLTIHLSS
jgi:hypothetical protein